MKFYPHGGIGREIQTAVAYNTVKDDIVQSVQKSLINGQDTALPLIDLKKKDLVYSERLERGQQSTKKEEGECTEGTEAGLDIAVHQVKLVRHPTRKE